MLPDTPFGAQRQLLALVDDGRDEFDEAPAHPLRAAKQAPRKVRA
jgi:hypothetical protein